MLFIKLISIRNLIYPTTGNCRLRIELPLSLSEWGVYSLLLRKHCMGMMEQNRRAREAEMTSQMGVVPGSGVEGIRIADFWS